MLDPASNVVKAVTPAPVLNRLRDLDDNLKEPRIFANDIVHGRFGAAYVMFGRFVFNSTSASAAFSTSPPRAGFRSRAAILPDPLCLGRHRGPPCGTVLFRSLDAARFGVRSRR